MIFPGAPSIASFRPSERDGDGPPKRADWICCLFAPNLPERYWLQCRCLLLCSGAMEIAPADLCTPPLKQRTAVSLTLIRRLCP